MEGGRNWEIRGERERRKQEMKEEIIIKKTNKPLNDRIFNLSLYLICFWASLSHQKSCWPHWCDMRKIKLCTKDKWFKAPDSHKVWIGLDQPQLNIIWFLKYWLSLDVCLGFYPRCWNWTSHEWGNQAVTRRGRPRFWIQDFYFYPYSQSVLQIVLIQLVASRPCPQKTHGPLRKAKS